MKLILGYTESNKDQLEKDFEEIKELDIHFKQSESKRSPKLRIKNTDDFIENINYAYIEKFNRYYFVNEWNFINNDIVEIELESDLLMTFKDTIKESIGNLTRSIMIEFIDTTVDFDVRKEVDNYKSGKEFGNDESTILVTLGGGYSG